MLAVVMAMVAPSKPDTSSSPDTSLGCVEKHPNLGQTLEFRVSIGILVELAPNT